MDINDNDAEDQNLHLVGEGSSKASPVLRSYALLNLTLMMAYRGIQGLMGFLDITSQQEDNQWIEEYSHGTSTIQFSSIAVESTRKNVWSEATSPESVERLLKAVGPEEKVLEVSDRSASITNIMDPNFKENFVGSKVSAECEQSQETQNSGRKLDSVLMSDKHYSSVEKSIEKIYDDVNQEASNSGNAGTSQHVENANGMSKDGNYNEPGYVIKGEENIMDNSTNSGKFGKTCTYSVEKLSVVLNIECMDKPLVEGSSVNEETKNAVGSVQQVTSGTSMLPLGNNQSEISEASEINDVCKNLVGVCSSAEIPAEDISNKDETDGNTDINVVGAADSQNNVKPSLFAEGCEGVNAMAQVAAVESRNISSPDTPDGVHLPSETVAKADAVIEDHPRSPILGVSLLHDENEKIMGVGFISEGTFQKQAPEVEKDNMSYGAENVVHGLAGGGGCGSSVGNLNMDPGEQTAGSNSESLLDLKESMAGEDAVEPLNLAVNASLDVVGPSECDTIPASADKPQISFSDTKNNELIQSSKDKLEVTKGSMDENIPLSSITKEEKNFTFVVSASASQNHSLSKNMKVSSVTSHGGQMDPIKLHEDSPVSQPSSSAATGAGNKGNSQHKPRKKSVGIATAEKSNHLKEQTWKVGKSSPLLIPPGQVTPVSNPKPVTNPKPGGLTPISTSNLHDLNNSTSIFHHSFTDYQQVQLRAQILVYGSLLSGMPPEEPHMIAAFGESDGGRRAWEATWHAHLVRVHGQKSQPNYPGSSTPDQGNKIGSAQSKFLSGLSSPIANPMISVASPLWNIPTPCDDGSQSILTPILSGTSLHPYQTPGEQNVAVNNPLLLSQSPFHGQWFASSPIAPFNARFPALPITESVKLTTVKESGAPSMPVIPVVPSAGPTVSPMMSSGQPSSDSKDRKRKKVVVSQFTTSAALSPPVSMNSKSIPDNSISTISPAHTHDQPRHVDQNKEKTVTREEIVSKIEESEVQAADAAVHAATAASAAVDHCENVWSQLESQKNSALVADDEAKLAFSAVSIAAAASVAKVAAAAAKIASNVTQQARLVADEVFLSSRKESDDQSSTTSIISAAKEAVRRRIEAAASTSKHAENLDAIVKAAELAAEAVSLAGKIVVTGNPLCLRELIEAGPKGYWNFPQLSELSNQEGYSDKQNIESVPNDKDDSGDFVKNQLMIVDGVSGSVTSYENDRSTASGHRGLNLSNTNGVITESEFGLVPSSNVDQNMHQRTSGTEKDNIIKEGCLVEVLKENNKKKHAWFAANVLTLKDGKAYVCYTEIQSDEGSGKLKEWVTLEAEGTEIPRLRIAHPMTTLQSKGTRKRNRTALADFAWCSGDRVDVWVQNCWCEAVVMEINKNDMTSLTVQFPAQGETSVVSSWHVRSALIWKDGKWIEWPSLKGSHPSEGDAPHEKRQKFSTPVVQDKAKDELSKSANLEKSGIHKKSTRSGLLREQSRVVFGVPKPGKKQKFMDVSTHRIADRNEQNNIPNDLVKHINNLTPQPLGSKNNSKNDAKEKEVAEVKSKVTKTRKPPIPSFKTSTQKDKLKPSKPTSRNAFLSDENLSGQSNMMDFDSSNAEDAKETSTSKAVGKNAAANRKAAKVLVQDNSPSEVEPRRSIRRIQPTSRLLEGLQSSLTVSKLHNLSHASQRSHTKITSKGSTDPN